jgi:hypothetical protein
MNEIGGAIIAAYAYVNQNIGIVTSVILIIRLVN